MTTIKELADQLGMPKQRVYRYVKNHIDDVHREAGVMHLDDAQVKQVSSALMPACQSDEAHHEAHHDALHDATVGALEDLRNQLKTKDAQIAELTEALRAAQENLKAAQTIQAIDRGMSPLSASSLAVSGNEATETRSKMIRWQRLRSAWRG